METVSGGGAMGIALAVVGLIILGLIVLSALWVVFKYNQLISLRNRIENAWSQIDVQLRRRYDLIPNLVETVKGYAAHEKEVFAKVSEARSAMMSAQGVAQQAEAQNQITSALKTLFAVAEAYPELKANENFMMLQEELSGTESKIAYARQFYNDQVMTYNTLTQMFPGSIIAGMFGFGKRDYFEMEDIAREPIKVDFNS
jgi:LemA protein